MVCEVAPMTDSTAAILDTPTGYTKGPIASSSHKWSDKQVQSSGMSSQTLGVTGLASSARGIA